MEGLAAPTWVCSPTSRIEGALNMFWPCFCPAVTDGRGWLVAPPHHPKFEKCCKAQIKRKDLRLAAQRGGRKYFLLRASLASFPSWPRLYFPVSPDLRDLRVAIKDLKLVWLAGWLSWRRNDHRSHVLIHRLRLHSPLSFHASRSYLHLIYLWSMIWATMRHST